MARPQQLPEEGRTNILIVDDRQDKLLVLRTVLEELGQNIVVAQSGEEALKRVLELDFAVILLDVNMPGMDGLETAEFIRQRQKTAHTPIIFVTAYADEIHTARGYSLGAVDYILAPIVPEILRSKVRVFVQLQQLTHEFQRQAAERVILAREQAARAAAEESILRFSFLADLSKSLEKSLNLDARAKELVRFVVPFLADLAALVLSDEYGRVSATEIAWVDPARPSEPVTASVELIQDAALTGALGQVLTTRRPRAIEQLEDAQTELSVKTREAPEPVSLSLGFTPGRLLALPLLGRGRVSGVLLLVSRVGRRFDPTEFSFCSDVAARAAVMLDNALLYQEVSEADSRKNEFLAMLGHELRNPMAPIRYAVQILRKPQLDETKKVWTLEIIERQVKQLARLVDDLLDVSRITRGRIELKLEPLDLAKVVLAAVETSRPLIDSLRHTLSVETSEEALHVQGDFARLTQVLANLLNNAAKYTEPGGRIQLQVARSGEEAVLRVRDSGIGILAENIEKIFELFAQVGRKDRMQGGLGVWLSLVQRLVRLHGGSVEALSAGAGQGTEFVVRLPLCDAAIASQATAQAEEPGSDLPCLRVLVVDDNVDSAEAMTAALRIEGHHADAAYDGETALQRALDFRPDAVVLDIGLPGMSGLEVARALRGLPETHDTVLVALSGYGQLEDKERSLAAGLDRHLTKPVDPRSLSALFASLRAARQGGRLAPTEFEQRGRSS